MKLLNVKTSALEEVADAQSAIIQGSHAPKTSEIFTFRDPSDGGVYEANGGELAGILKAGGILETPIDVRQRELSAKYADSPILGAGLGAARGLTFGLSDAAAAGMGFGEDVAAIKENNPYSSILGEVGGIVIPTLLSGGAGAVGAAAKMATAGTRAATRGAEAIAATALGAAATKTVAGEIVSSLGAKTLAGAIEGASFGVGQSITEASLGQPVNVAENLLVGGAFGSVIPLIGAGLTAVGKGAVEKVFPAITAATGSGKRTELEQFYALSATGQKTRQLVHTGPEVVKDRLVELARANDDLAKEAGKWFKETKFAQADELLGHVASDDIAIRTGGFEKLRIKFDETLAKFAENPNSYDSGIAKEIRKVGDDFVMSMGGATDAASGFKALDELKSRLYAASKVAARNQTPQDIAASKAARDLYHDATALLTDESVWGKAASMQSQMNTAYSEFIGYKTAFEQRFTSKFGTERRVDARKIITYANKQGTAEAADMAEALEGYISSSNTLRQVIGEHSIPKKLAGTGSAATDANGKLMESLQEMSVLRTYENMGGGNANRMLFSPGGIQQLFSLVNPTGKFAVQVLGAADRALQKVNGEWLTAIGKTFDSLKTSGTAVTALSLGSLGDARETGNRILALAGSPDALGAEVEAATGQLQLAAPKAAAAMQQMNANAIQYLAQKVPANPNQDELGQQADWKPSDAEAAIWKRHLEAARSPMTLLSDFSSGNLAPETVETVKALYPAFYEKSVAAIGQYIAEKQPKMPYARRLQLSVLMQAPIEPSLKQANLLALQMTYADAQVAAQPTNKPIETNASAQMTPGQRLSGR